MNTYSDVLKALYILLDRCGETFWKEQLYRSHSIWRRGMSWFSDLYLCPENGHQVELENTPWVNTLLFDLQGIGRFIFTKSAPFTIEEIEDYLKHDYMTQDETLNGWRCLTCGYSEVSFLHINWYLGRKVVRQEVLKAMTENRLVYFVENEFWTLPQKLKDKTLIISKQLQQCGITVYQEDRYIVYCPHCGSRDTAVYRWIQSKEKPEIFIPASDNLPLTGQHSKT